MKSSTMAIDSKTSRMMDRTGILASTGCLIHCVALPIATYLLPNAGFLDENETLHFALYGVATLAFVLSFGKLCVIREKTGAFGLGILGWMLLTIGTFMPLTEFAEAAFMLAASTVLIAAHVWKMSGSLVIATSDGQAVEGS